jgi:hypothetical protein
MVIKSMLPQSPPDYIKDGLVLFGDDLDLSELTKWYEIESEAFFYLENNSKASINVPWYDYNRYINNRHVWNVIRNHFSDNKLSLLVVGPGSGEELESFVSSLGNIDLRLIESSAEFRKILAEKFPNAYIESGNAFGITDNGIRYDAIVGLQVLHHIANVSTIIDQLSNQLKENGLLILREPCSSMGVWGIRHKNLSVATPNERGISRFIISKAAKNANLSAFSESYPLAICLDPLNIVIRRLNLYGILPHSFIYVLDKFLSACLSINDHYWRDRWWKKFGPSTYHYVYKKSKQEI